MDEVEELEHTVTIPHPAAPDAADLDAASDDDLDATLAALLRQTARLRAIELQLTAVFDIRGHTQSMRRAIGPDAAATDCA
jgi:hypothetical protein